MVTLRGRHDSDDSRAYSGTQNDDLRLLMAGVGERPDYYVVQKLLEGADSFRAIVTNRERTDLEAPR